MKKILSIIIPVTVLALLGLLPSCKKSESPSHLANVSFPIMTMNGPKYSTVNRGTAWTDPGVTWRDSVTGESGTLTVTANTSNDTAYLFIYTATNKNGFKSTITRGLGVTNYTGPIDISGLYTDANGHSDSVYMVSRAMYYHPDVAQTQTADYAGDQGLIVIKSDSTISVSTVYSASTGTVGATLPTTFSDANIIYQSPYYYTGTPPRLTAQPPVIFSYRVHILNVTPYTATFTHALH